VRTVVGVVLTPHRSTMGSGEYLRRATEALGDDVEFLPVEQWYDAPGFAALLAGRVHAALDRLPPSTEGARLVLFTAHSLPERVRTNAAEAGIDNWRVAWQSAGRTPEPWIGPDILEVIKALPDEGIGAVVVCPVGFVSDHLEVLFDVDIEAKAVADTAGVTLVRTPSLNADPEFLDILAKVVVATAGAGATS
jgi:ferrochelatase